MKKLSIIAWVVLLGTLWACSKEQPTVDPDTAWAFDETLPVPIQLGGGEGFSVFTKSTDDEGKRINSLVGEEIWIGGLDLHIGTTLQWGDEDLYCKSVKNYALADDDFLFSGTHYVKAEVNSDGTVQFLNGTDPIKRYYPFSETKRTINGNDTTFMHMGKNYSFVAYHTPQLNVAPKTYNDSLQIKTFRLSTNYGDIYNQDVLWARADARPIVDPRELAADDEANNGYFRGFNARHQRRLAKANGGTLALDDYPMLRFQHATSLIHIFVMAKDAAAQASFGGDISITEMKVNNKFQYLALNLVSGEIIPDPTNTKVQAELLPYYKPTTQAPYSYPAPIYPVVTPQEYNHGFFVMPGERTEDEKIQISFVIDGVEGSKDERTKKVDLPFPPALNGYEAGVEYSYYITIDSTQQILLRASLENWDNTSGAEQLQGVEDIVIE